MLEKRAYWPWVVGGAIAISLAFLLPSDKAAAPTSATAAALPADAAEEFRAFQQALNKAAESDRVLWQIAQSRVRVGQFAHAFDALDHMASVELRALALGPLAVAGCAGDPAKAEGIARGIKDPLQRAEALAMLARNQAAANPDRAQAILEKSLNSLRMWQAGEPSAVMLAPASGASSRPKPAMLNPD